MRKWIVLLAVTLCLGGCLEKVDGSAPREAKQKGADDDKPRQVCEYTSEGGEPKTVCY